MSHFPNRPRISMIVAVSKNGVIGREQSLPWNIPEDLKYFKEKTYGSPVIMGRKTFDSIGFILPGRRNVILTRSRDRLIPKAKLVSNIEEAIEAASETNGTHPPDEIFIVGGGDVYRLALPYADRLYVTEIDLTIEGDTTFLDWPKLAGFRETGRDERAASDDGKTPSFRFLVFDRDPPLS